MPLKKTALTELHYALALLHVSSSVFKHCSKLWQKCNTFAEIFTLPSAMLHNLGFSEEEISRILQPDWSAVEEDLIWAKSPGQHIITLFDSNYPKLLKEIADPPFLLFAQGNLQLLQTAQLAIVGSRNPTPMGSATAFAFAKELAAAGLTITSGFASGIDAASHRGALAAGGNTIAVMGTGLEKIYPRHHKRFAAEIIANDGLLLSEFALHADAVAWHFPLRNRIISGMSLGILVVEAALRSGSLITARCANEQGREVFAVPGSIHNPLTRGCHYLLQQGAKLVENSADILEELPDNLLLPKSQTVLVPQANLENKLDCQHKKLLHCIGHEVVTIDVLIGLTGFPVAVLAGMLAELEVMGLIKSVYSGYVRVM